MFLVGLTGGIATGKSTVSSMFSKLGVPIIDADVMARRVVEPRKRAWRRIKDTFGEDVFHSDGTLNREALGSIIFEDAAKRRQLNQIVHPEVFREMCWEIIFAFIRGYKYVILDIPLLFESGMWVKHVNPIIVVSCEQDLQIQRLMQRNPLSETDAISRINAQMSLSEKRSKAHHVIENSGSVDDTQEQVLRIYEELNKSKAYLKIRVAAFAIFAIIAGGVSFVMKCLVYGTG